MTQDPVRTSLQKTPLPSTPTYLNLRIRYVSRGFERLNFTPIRRRDFTSFQEHDK